MSIRSVKPPEVFIYGTDHIGIPHPKIRKAFSRAKIGTIELSETFDSGSRYLPFSIELQQFVHGLSQSRKNKQTHSVDVPLNVQVSMLKKAKNIVGQNFFQCFGFFHDHIAHRFIDELHTHVRDIHQSRRIAKLALRLKPGQTLVHVGGHSHTGLPRLVKKELDQHGIRVCSDYHTGRVPDFIQDRVNGLLAQFLPFQTNMNQVEANFGGFLDEYRVAIQRLSNTEKGVNDVLFASQKMSDLGRISNDQIYALSVWMHRLPTEDRMALLQENDPEKKLARTLDLTKQMAVQKKLPVRLAFMISSFVKQAKTRAILQKKWPPSDNIVVNRFRQQIFNAIDSLQLLRMR